MTFCKQAKPAPRGLTIPVPCGPSSFPSSPSPMSSRSTSFPSTSRPRKPFPAPTPTVELASSSRPPPRNEYRRQRRRAICGTESDSDSACSVTSSPRTPASMTLPPEPPRGPRPIPTRKKTDSVGRAECTAQSIPRQASSVGSRARLGASAPTTHFPPPPSINSSTSNSSLSGSLYVPSDGSHSRSVSHSIPSSPPVSHPFLVDQTPYLPRTPRRTSATSFRSTASASSAIPSNTNPIAPWARDSPAAMSVEAVNGMGRDRIGSFGSGFRSAADHMLAVDDNAGSTIARAITPPHLGPRRQSHSIGTGGLNKRCAGAGSTRSLGAIAAPPRPPAVPVTSQASSMPDSKGRYHSMSALPPMPTSHHAATTISPSASQSFNHPLPPLRPQPQSAALGAAASIMLQTPRSSAASSLSARSASSSSSSIHTPTPSSPETSPTMAIDRRCLTWMREAELHAYYFGSVQSRGALTLSAKERHTHREPLIVPPQRDAVEVLQEEKRSCNPLKRFTSRREE